MSQNAFFTKFWLRLSDIPPSKRQISDLLIRCLKLQKLFNKKMLTYNLQIWRANWNISVFLLYYWQIKQLVFAST